MVGMWDHRGEPWLRAKFVDEVLQSPTAAGPTLDHVRRLLHFRPWSQTKPLPHFPSELLGRKRLFNPRTG